MLAHPSSPFAAALRRPCCESLVTAITVMHGGGRPRRSAQHGWVPVLVCLVGTASRSAPFPSGPARPPARGMAPALCLRGGAPDDAHRTRRRMEGEASSDWASVAGDGSDGRAEEFPRCLSAIHERATHQCVHMNVLNVRARI